MGSKSRPAKAAMLETDMKNSVFLNNLEGWIDELISKDGLADKELVKMIKQKFECAMQANINYHTFMMDNARADDHGNGERHKLMVAIYQELLPA